jgi:hypothetical protein
MSKYPLQTITRNFITINMEIAPTNLLDGDITPLGKDGLRGLDGGVDISGGGEGHVADDVLSGRVHHGERSIAQRIHELAINEILQRSCHCLALV